MHINVVPINTTWQGCGLDDPYKVNVKYLQLVQVLAGIEEDLDVNFMLMREPSILCLSNQDVARRLVRIASLIEDKVDHEGKNILIGNLLEKQPNLLLVDNLKTLEILYSGFSNSSQFGESEKWKFMLQACQEYFAKHGDLLIGERGNDEEDAHLIQWI